MKLCMDVMSATSHLEQYTSGDGLTCMLFTLFVAMLCGEEAAGCALQFTTYQALEAAHFIMHARLGCGMTGAFEGMTCQEYKSWVWMPSGRI